MHKSSIKYWLSIKEDNRQQQQTPYTSVAHAQDIEKIEIAIQEWYTEVPMLLRIIGRKS
jgi:hypothetical protein